MKLETLFEKFDLFADATGAVTKMRELVLQLAVTGKLVAQDNRDKPALSLVESAKAERAKLVGARKIKARPTTAVEADEQPYTLPSSWEWARLSDVGYELGQKVPDKRFTYIDVGGIDSDKGRISDRVEKLEPGDAPSRARKLVAHGTVIYSTVRPYLLNIAIVDQDFDLEPIASTAFGILHPFEGVNNRYLFYWLRSAPFTAYVQACMKGMAYPAINDEKFYSGFIALPPLAEQKRIVSKVDELMALCDRLETQQQERETRHAALARASLARFADAPTPANLPFLFYPSYAIPPADLRKSILTLAVQGKLVPQDPNDEPADELLKRSLAERRKLKRTEATEVQPLPAEDALDFDIPESWRWQRLDDLLVFGPTNGFSPKAVDYETPVRSLTLSATTSGRFKGQHSKFITTEVSADSDLWLHDGDILVQRGNTIEYVGVAAVYRGEPNCFVYPDLMMKLRVSSAFDVGFIHLAMSHEAARDFLRARASGTSGSMPKINQTTLKSLPLPIPPLAEQRRIVAKVEQLLALVDALETQLAASRTTAVTLLSALVAELTGTTRSSKVSVHPTTRSGSRGRPRKSP